MNRNFTNKERIATDNKLLISVLVLAILLSIACPVFTNMANAAIGLVYSPELIVPTEKEIMDAGYPINENGETFGPDLKDGSLVPDLILAEGNDSILGYIRVSEIPGANVDSPKSAIEFMQSEKETMILLYLQDGKTSIGEFELSTVILTE